MKNLILTIVGLTLSFYCNSQSDAYHPFPTENTVWREFFGGSEVSYCSDYQFIIIGDTIIDNLTYHKIQKAGVEYMVDQWGWCTNVIYLYFNFYRGAYRNDSVNKKVYLRENENDTLLYDFDLNLGDTLPRSYTSYGEFNYVATIDSILLGNEFHKRLGIATLDDPVYVYNYLIEGIGSTGGLLSNIQPPFEFGTILLCFTQDGKTIYPDTNYICDLITSSGHELTNNRSYQLHPNPFSNYARIEMDSHFNNAEFQLYNAYGKEVIRIQNIGDGTVIDGSNLPAGVYIFKIMCNNTTLQMGKVLKL